MKLKKTGFFSYLRVLAAGFLMMLIILIPNIIKNHGIFLYAGDYTFQQIPFYYHAADTVKNLGIGWDWFTDLGSDFITSYSYYLTGSIFFWMISWLPGMAVVYAMPVMIALKTAIGGLGAFAYIKRYVQNDDAAFVGAIMYAFSGFQMASLVFNTFHDITALFPFLLLAFDLLVTENKKSFFSLIVGITALTNYFFFVGIVVFVIMYYIVKCIKKEFTFTVKNFMLIVAESIVGAGIAAIILIPTFLALISADRVGDTLYGIDLISYSDNTIIPKIIQSMFLIPDPPSGAMLFLSSDNTHNWASISLYLPLFTITGVAVYIKNNKKSWLTFLLLILGVIACVPGLNGIFSMMNVSYYARWFYMPVLLMCLATSRAIDSNYDFIPGIKIQAIGTVVLSLISCLPDKVIKESEKLNTLIDNNYNPETEIRMFGISKIPVVFWQCIAFSVIFLLFVFVYNHEKEKDKKILKKISAVMVSLVILTYIIFINNTVIQTQLDEKVSYNSSIGFTPKIEDDDVFRISHANNNSMNNYSMLWGYMNAGCFHSVESNESDDFYYGVQGNRRMMNSQYKEEDYPVYGLLSIKYIFNLSTNDDLNVEFTNVNLKGCSLYDKQGPYYIYKNDNFVPMGFMYDYCIDDVTLENYLDENILEEDRYQYKKLIMMRALVLTEEDKEKYSAYISDIPEEMLELLDENTYAGDCTDRSAQSCSYFEYNSKGYKADISCEKSGLLYFSVPCSEGWTAKVNGRTVDIIKAHYGLTAVPVEQGDNHIEFVYETPGLRTGIIISAVSCMVFLLYVIYVFLSRKTKSML